jgi:hypothetical protein
VQQHKANGDNRQADEPRTTVNDFGWVWSIRRLFGPVTRCR